MVTIPFVRQPQTVLGSNQLYWIPDFLSAVSFFELRRIIGLFMSLSAKECGPLDVPVNGTKSGNETTYPNEVIFSCDKGFNLRGSTKRMCTTEGIWSGVKTFCEGMNAINIVYVIESAAYGVICTSCLCQKPERARYERVRAFDKNNECI